MMIQEFIEKSKLQEKINDGIINHQDAIQVFNRVNALYLLSDYQDNSDCIKYYNRYGLNNLYKKVYKTYLKSIDDTIYINPYGVIRVKSYNTNTNNSYEKSYMFYTRHQAIKHNHNELWLDELKKLNYFK